MNVEELLKENKELKEKLEKLLMQRESMKPFLCSDKKCRWRETPKFCECGRIINNQ